MQAAMQLATPHSTKRKARILVVDDDPGLLRLLTIRLRAENYEVEAVESAALALAATSRGDAVLLIEAPAADTGQLTYRVRLHQVRPLDPRRRHLELDPVGQEAAPDHSRDGAHPVAVA